MRCCRLSLFAPALVLGLAGGWYSECRSQDSLPRGGPKAGGPTAKSFALLGAGSCSAAACHNGPGFDGYRGREYAVALQRDPTAPRQPALDAHARAYAVLFERRAQTMERQLHPNQPGARAETDLLCLRCHVHPGLDSSPLRLTDGAATFDRADGVSCEACHGPAQGWLADHFRGGWSALSAGERLAQGQHDTRSVAGRVGVCVACHVGAPGMEVNHDLIAAGHPRLNFEFASFHFLLHKHWAPTSEPADFESRAWPFGQLAAARSALALLAYRAAPDSDRPWPEFAEYDCAACHHPLTENGPRQRLGKLIPTRWYTSLLPAALQTLGVKDGGPLRLALAELDQALSTNRPNRRVVVDRAQQALALLDEQLARTADRPAEVLAFTRLLPRAEAPSNDERLQLELFGYTQRRARQDGSAAVSRSSVRLLLDPFRLDKVNPAKSLDSLKRLPAKERVP